MKKLSFFHTPLGNKRCSGRRKFFISSFGVSFYLFPKRQTRIYDASIVLAVIPAMVATNAPARVQRVFLTLTVIK